MSNEFTVKKATRQGVNPLIGFYGASGGGKTYSALLLSRGLVGPSGKLIMIDTESGRGSLYADVIPGGYEVIRMGEPFSPRRYIEALRAAHESGAQCIIVDSASHEWEAIGSVQDMAMQSAKSRADKYNREWDGVVQFGDWKAPKLEHAKMMIAMLQSKCPVIVCLRAKRKSHQVKGTAEMAKEGIIEERQIGKNVVIKDQFTTPIHDENFIYEMTVHAEIQQDHTMRVTKCPLDLIPVFQSGKMVSIETGAALDAWCKGSKPALAIDRKAVGKRLQELSVGKCDGTPEGIAKWLMGLEMLGLDDTLRTTETARLAEIVATLERQAR